MSFPSISPKQSFPALESEVLAYWKANNTFQKSVDSRPEDNPYRFYDGPPFITGMPHYGNLLSSIVKDVIGRYWTMRGHRVDRTWGWDCHGLPIEEKVQKKLWLKSNADIEANGVKKFIDECYAYTSEVSSEWNWYIDKIGRWVDMDNAYRTMDQDYMESVMWVFSELWKKWLIYEGKRVSLYSWKLGTPISNFEVAMDDTYQEVNDPAITVKFALEPNDRFPAGTSILAWTTTPWTIPANMALAVRNDIDYVLVSLPSFQRGMSEGQGDLVSEKSEQNPQSLRDSSFAKELTEQYIVAKNRAETVFKWKWEFTIIRELKGSDLVGLGYVPPFPEYYYEKYGKKNHKVYHADFITDTDGTGIGHEAPEFGEVDFQLAKKEGIHISNAMDDAGHYTAEIYDYEGTHYLDLENPEKWANRINIERMKANNTLFKLENITHRVPFCPRSGTPLMQKAQKSWFIDIQSQKDKLIEANEQINWFPEYLKEWRFKKGIETAPDWCISRTRYWGAPMPVWIGEDGEKMVVSSREEIYEANKAYRQLEAREVEWKTIYHFKWGEYDGVEFNLHKPYIDSVLLQNPKATKAKKVLGVHGRWSDINKQSWLEKKEVFEKSGMSLDLFQFHQGEDPTYESWKTVFQTIEFSDFDAIYTSSLGGVMTTRYLAETGQKVPRIVMVAPWISNNVAAGLKPNMKSIYDSLGSLDITNIADEIIVLHAKDDETVPFDNGKAFAEKLWAIFVPTQTGNHAFKWQYNLIAALAQFWAPMTRIPEVLDVWMDSGSMPYAQMHYPFENKEAMQASFPADFIAEYVGQLRAWFYVMHVLGVLLDPLCKEGAWKAGDLVSEQNSQSLRDSSFTKGARVIPAFLNVITTGVVNGNDGRKMSKSFGNYPDPRMAIEKYGADPIRFYMLNSPLLSGGDMDFKEEGIMETIKWVMLPLWNTYSFFTTYANIDKWEKDETEVWFTRHAESTSNVAGRMSDATDNPELTEKGRRQARDAGMTLKSQWAQFDLIIHTWLDRTIETAKIIGDITSYSGEYLIDTRFVEQLAWEYAGKTLEEMAKDIWCDAQDHETLRKSYKNNTTENINQFEERILSAYKDLLEAHAGKKILIVGHSGTPKPILYKYLWMNKDIVNYKTAIKNADPFRLVTTPLVNDLDRWILSKLQVLLGQVHNAMDGYDVSRACRTIVDYMDHLTNWYVRLSRRRFWESGMTSDKASAYETLYTVLVEVSKLMAPLMPFLSESVYQGLTKRESVHLEYATFPNRHLIANDLNRDMEKCENIVSLGLALRSQKNIRVRQPLQSVTITADLSEYYQSIISDELNVKEIKLENPEKLAKKIAKPDAKKIGPKYGKDVQSIIVLAKNGEFEEIEGWKIKVWNFILEEGEYTVEYLPLEWVGDVIGGYGMVLAMDTAITEDLKLEGYARDIIRLIQDMRKESGYEVTDRISLSLIGDKRDEIIAKFGPMIESETLSTLCPQIDLPDTMREESIDEDSVVQIAIKR
jgi:isoleucyl-tRNA synthetase